MLGWSDQELCDAHDLVMLDLDGVVYVGGAAVPRAAESIEVARRRGMHPAFITNNASRPPQQVAQHLTDLGVRAEVADVVTSDSFFFAVVFFLVPTASALRFVPVFAFSISSAFLGGSSGLEAISF